MGLRKINVSCFFYYFLVLAVIIQTGYYILKYPFFSFSDEHEMISYFLDGVFPWRYAPELGRVYFFSLIEYFPVVSSSVSIQFKLFLIYLICAIKFFLLLSVSFLILKRFVGVFFAFVSVMIMYVILLKYGITTTIISIVYPEFTLSIVFLAFFYLYFKAVDTQKKRYYLLSLLCYVFSLFCKEPAFVVGLCCSGLLLFIKPIGKREKYFLSACGILSVAYVVFYFFGIYPNIVHRYGANSELFSEFIIAYCKINFMFILGIILLLARLSVFIIHKSKCHRYDVFLVAGVCYSVSFIFLKMHSGYYFIPSVIFISIGMSTYCYSVMRKKRCLSLIKRVELPLSCLICTMVLFTQYYYMNNISEQYTLKKITMPSLAFVKECKAKGIVVENAYPAGENETNIDPYDAWTYLTVKLFFRFYENWISQVRAEDSRSVAGKYLYIFLPNHKNKEPELPELEQYENLDLVFFAALVKKTDIPLVKDAYCRFAADVTRAGIRPHDRDGVLSSAKKAGCF